MNNEQNEKSKTTVLHKTDKKCLTKIYLDDKLVLQD